MSQTEDLTETYQQTLEAAGVPTTQARAAAIVLQKQNADPTYQLTEEEIYTKQMAYTWLVAN